MARHQRSSSNVDPSGWSGDSWTASTDSAEPEDLFRLAQRLALVEPVFGALVAVRPDLLAGVSKDRTAVGRPGPASAGHP
jgi:hypothetical protein